MSTLKTDRSKEHDTFLQLLVNLEERAEALFCPPQPVDKDLNQTSSNLQFTCELCKHESESETALHGHKSLTHDKYSPHTSQWHQNKCHICKIQFTTPFKFRSHITSKQNFSENINVCFICMEFKKVGLYLPMMHQ